MNKCLYCGLEVKPTEFYQEIQIYECLNKHRIGIIAESESLSNELKRLKLNIIPDILI